MAFDAFSGSSGYWAYSIAGVSTTEGDPSLVRGSINWDRRTSLEYDETIVSWRINVVSEPIKTMTFDSDCNTRGVVFPEVDYYGGVGSWGGALTGICSTDGQFQVGTPLICDFLFHSEADIGRHDCRIIVTSIEEFTAVTEQTAKFTIQFMGSGLLPPIT
jgi:hypothetical protein